MSLLPTAHAGQSFGARRVDYFTVSGQVASVDGHQGIIIDADGMEHEVRLMESSSALAPGDQASVLRVQSGPKRRSRAVAVVNHSRGVWLRAEAEATTTLSKSGVTRSFNWWLSIVALVLVAALAVWPALHAFLTEINGAMMAGVPAFNVFSELISRMPGLDSWRLEMALPDGLYDAVSSFGWIPMGQLTEWGLGLGAAGLALLAFTVRSWRLLYVPALTMLALLAGAVLGGAEATLVILALTAVLFMLGGFVNRVRDGGRFNARVERLSEHVLRHPPEEGVRLSREPAASEARFEAADPMIDEDAVAEDAVSEAEISEEVEEVTPSIAPEEDAALEYVEAESGDGTTSEAAASDAAQPAEHASDRDEKQDPVGLPVAASGAVAVAAAQVLSDTNDEGAHEADPVPEDAGSAAEAVSDVAEASTPDTEGDEAAAVTEADPVDAASEIETETVDFDQEVDIDQEAETVLDAGGVQEADPAEAEAEADLDDELPSEAELAAARAAAAAEDAGETVETKASAADDPLDDERTMPVAAPPPMPAQTTHDEGTSHPVEEDAVEADGEAEDSTQAESPVDAPVAEITPAEAEIDEVEPTDGEPSRAEPVAAGETGEVAEPVEGVEADAANENEVEEAVLAVETPAADEDSTPAEATPAPQVAASETVEAQDGVSEAGAVDGAVEQDTAEEEIEAAPEADEGAASAEDSAREPVDSDVDSPSSDAGAAETETAEADPADTTLSSDEGEDVASAPAPGLGSIATLAAAMPAPSAPPTKTPILMSALGLVMPTSAPRQDASPTIDETPAADDVVAEDIPAVEQTSEDDAPEAVIAEEGAVESDTAQTDGASPDGAAGEPTVEPPPPPPPPAQ